jgi:hypothetical protein
MKRFVLMLGAAFAPPVASAGEQAQQEIIIADLRAAPVFYQVAPTYLATSMQAAIQRECSASSRGEESILTRPGLREVREWLCSNGPLFFLHGIYAQGEESEDGYACKGEAEWKYYSPGWFMDNEDCIAVSYDSEKKRHFLD